jgi:hypothetical protein
MFWAILSVMARSILPLYYLPGEAELALDTSRVPALKDDENELWERINKAVASGYMMVSEAREELGLEDAGPTSQIFLRPMNILEIPVGTSAPLVLDDGGGKGPLLDVIDVKAGGEAPDDKERRKLERAIYSDTRSFFAQQLDRLIDQVDQDYPGRG